MQGSGEVDTNASLAPLCRCVQALVQPAPVQLSLYPAFVCVGDELVLDFDDALRACVAARTAFPADRAASLAALDARITQLSGPCNEEFWLDRARLAADPRWDELRVLARAVLDAFGWPDVVPDPDGATYVNAHGDVTRNVVRRAVPDGE